ncbi:MAG: precorrin-6Y C5,15-methyltransferase (decarboxylating) subunit CbiT [Clostridiales bacterium]|jgi:precorrin-6Y C5,15-methyltransferase (decarboxylating)|nr:precorrin-6Y C5,15-methyltransferase (decarboxylating) subunit CbiT [Clostridiales bacterium]
MKVALIGLGAGMECLIPDARHAAMEADLLIGAPRLLALAQRAFPDDGEHSPEFRQEIWPGRIADLLLEKRDVWADKNIALLYSGDTGFYSGAGSFLKELEKRVPGSTDPQSSINEDTLGFSLTVFPGISSIQMLSAAIRRPWQNWTLVSAHGRDCDPAGELRLGRDTFFLTGGRTGAQKLCRDLCDAGLGEQRVWVGENLGMNEEKITSSYCRDAAETEFSPLAVVLVEGVRDVFPVMGIPDNAFIRGQVPMTKREVRLCAVSKMQAAPEETIWDVGAGTGSVSVELARQAKGGAVYAIERKEEACSLILKNRRKFHLTNMHLVRGEAPDALHDLPKPDAVFIGGSDGTIREIIREAVRRNPEVRIVFTGIVLETVSEGLEVLRDLGREPEVMQVAVSRSRSVRGCHMMLAENPVYVISG